jgi:hypothetical protein
MGLQPIPPPAGFSRLRDPRPLSVGGFLRNPRAAPAAVGRTGLQPLLQADDESDLRPSPPTLASASGQGAVLNEVQLVYNDFGHEVVAKPRPQVAVGASPRYGAQKKSEPRRRR